MDSALSLLAKGFLNFSHPIIMIPVVIIGFLVQKNTMLHTGERGSILWTNLCLLILFSMIFNAFLKSLFLVPLNPAIGKEGFAYPSGHMQVSMVFYGALFRAYSHRWVRGILLMILAGIAYGLIQQGYHDLRDVVAAIGFGIATLFVFAYLQQLPLFQKSPPRLGLCLIPLAGLMVGIIHYRIQTPSHIPATFMGFGVISLGWYFYNRAFLKSVS